MDPPTGTSPRQCRRRSCACSARCGRSIRRKSCGVNSRAIAMKRAVAKNSRVETFARLAAAHRHLALGRRPVLHPRRKMSADQRHEVTVTLKRSAPLRLRSQRDHAAQLFPPAPEPRSGDQRGRAGEAQRRTNAWRARGTDRPATIPRARNRLTNGCWAMPSAAILRCSPRTIAWKRPGGWWTPH